MQTFELILLLIVAVLISAVLERIIPRVSLPLIQIAIGFVIAMLAVEPIAIDLDPEFFLLVFIAPLLFYDAKESDKHGLWKNRSYILLLAVGLVVVIMLCVGFAVNLMEPSIPLAAAFALGAALGPTDAVAVASLSDVASVERKESALLSGESLLNDASGVVAFQFAVAAAVTGTFTVVDSSLSFLVSFFGGIALGAAIAALAYYIRQKIDRLGLDSNTFHVMFDITLPFITYLLSEVIGVSGILGVVAAGIVLSSLEARRIGPSAAHLSIVSNSTWSVISFGLNGVVFTILGMQLPKATLGTWNDVAISNTRVIAYVLVITAILVLVRFIWVLAIDYLVRDPDTGQRREKRDNRIRSALITTIGGPKGAVTLSVILSTPFLVASGRAFPQRDLIIFLASGVILCTLVLANFLLPVLAPRSREDDEDEERKAAKQIEVLRTVIERLSASSTKETARAVNMVIASYNQRIERIQSRYDLEAVSTVNLRIDVIKHEIEHLFSLMEQGEIDEYEGYRYVRHLSQAHSRLKDSPAGRFNTRWIRRLVTRTLARLRRWRTNAGVSDTHAEYLAIQERALTEAVRYLEDMLQDPGSPYPAEVVSHVLNTTMDTLRAVTNARPSITSYTRTADRLDRVERLAYTIELEEIESAYDRGDISRSLAKEMRENVYLMLVDLEVIEA